MANSSSELYLGETKTKKKSLVMPNRNGTKDQRFFLKMCQYMWSNYTRGYSSIGYGGYSGSGKSYTSLRLYSQGQQDKRQYAKLLNDIDPLTNKGEMNINWDIVQILPKFVDIVVGKMTSIDFDVKTQALDEGSTKARLRKQGKMKLLTNPRVQQFMKQYNVAPPDVQLPEFIKTAEDVDMYIKMGGARLDYEMAMRDCLESTKYESGWETLKDKVVKDVVDLGICAMKTKCHPKTHKVKSDYVDPEKLIIQESKYSDHRDSKWVGEIRSITIGQLREESDLTEKEIIEVVKKYKGFKGNADNFVPPNIDLEKSYRNTSEYDASNFGYNNFRIDVLEAYFIAKDAERYLVGHREDNNSYIYDKMKKTNAKLTEDMEAKGHHMEDKVTEKCYKCFWVIGTDCIYDAGEEYAIVKKDVNGVKEALLPIQVYSSKMPSLVERCTGFVDDIQLAVLKKRNVLAKMAPGPRMVLDKSKFRDSVKIGTKKYSMLDLLRKYIKSGVMIVESIAEFEEGEGGNPNPIQFLPTGITEDISILLSDIAGSIDQIRNVTGLNEVADGSSQRQDMLQSVMEGLNAATNNALRPTFRIYEGLHFSWAKYCVLKWQTALIGGDIKVEFVPIGDNSIKTVSISNSLYLYDFGVIVTMVPSAEDRQMLLRNLEAYKANNQVDVADYFVIYNMVQGGDVKKAQLYFSKAAKEHQALMHRRQIELQEAQGKANGEGAMMAEQARAKTMQLSLQKEMQLLAVKAEEERKTLTHEYELKLKLADAMAGQQLTNNVIDKSLDKSLENKENIQVNKGES
jgi:hypothetical protein